jgi:diketogulonate reductase-like aldo/keto reductase
MRHKELANTGVEIPEIGLGTWQYRGGVEPLKKGVSCGAFLIDTAEAYGTEDVVGKAIRGMLDEVFIATKVSPRNFRHDDVIRAADKSLKRLSIDRIDLYQLHWPSPDIPIEETMSAMDELVEAGKVRFIGVSNFSMRQFIEAQDAASNKIVSNQVRYNLLDRSIERELLPYCQQNGVTVIAYSPLARGLRNLKTELGGTLEQIAQAAGKTEAQVALNWLVSKDNVIAIPKSNSAERTEQNCGASDWSLSTEDLNLLERAYAGARRG